MKIGSIFHGLVQSVSQTNSIGQWDLKIKQQKTNILLSHFMCNLRKKSQNWKTKLIEKDIRLPEVGEGGIGSGGWGTGVKWMLAGPIVVIISWDI